MPFDDQDQQVDLDTWEKRVFEKHGVPEGLRMSIRSQESGGDVNATSPTGVKGRYQVTQGAAKQFGLNRDDPWEQPVAAAKLLRQNYDNAKTRNPKFSDRQAWLAASASYYAGSDAFDASGNLSTGSKDGLSNPSRYAESIAKRWSDFERGQVKPEQPFLSADQPSPLQRSIRPGTQKTTVRGPVRPVQLNPFSLAAPDIVGDAAAIAGRISPEVAAEADRAGRELARFQSRSRIGQLGEVAAGGLMQGVDQTVKAASYVNPLPMASAFRGRGALTPAAAQNLQAQQSAQDVALPNTAPIVRGTVAAGVQLPAIAMAGPAAPLVAGGLAASSADWRDPKRAALQTAIGLAGGAAGGKLAQMAIRPATIGGRLASGVAGGAAGNVIPTAVEQLAYEGKLNPQQLAQQAVIGAATGAALPPGVDPRSGGRQPVQGGESPGQIRAKYARPRGTPLSDAVATMDAIQAERTSTDRLPEGWGGEEVRGTAALPEPVRPPSNPLDVNQANATEAKINASQAENLGDWTRARTEYDTAHAAMVRMRRALGRTPGAEDEISALDREISAADLNRKRAARQILATEREQRAASRVRPAARQQDAVENAPTADLPAENRPIPGVKAQTGNELPLAETNPLLKSVVNPESGILQRGLSDGDLKVPFKPVVNPEIVPAPISEPSEPSPTVDLTPKLQRQVAQSRRKSTSTLSAIEYLKRKTNREGIRVSDRGEARVLGAREAGIVGLTNRASKYAVSDAQVMLDEGGFNLPDGRKFTDPSVTENDVLSFLTEFGREGRMNTRDLDNRIEQESADYYANQPPSEPLRATSNRLPRIGDLPPSRVSRNLQPEKPEIPRGTDRPLTVTEQARQAGGSTEDLARLDRLNRRLAVEEPRPYGERTRPGEPGSGGRSLSPYADMMANNKQAFDQLEKMDLESPEAGEILARIDDYVERRRIDPVHLERKLNAIRGDQAREAGLTDREIGSAPLRRTSTSELQDFYSRPDETPAKSEPLKPVRGVRAPESVKEAAPVEPEPQAAARNPHHVSLDTAASDKTNRVDVRKWVAVAKDESRKPDARKNAVKRLMSLTGIRDPEQMRAALQDYEFPMTATDRDVAAMSEENLTRAIETSDTQSARRIREGSPTSPQDVERSKALNDERRHRVAMGAMKSLYEKRPGRGNEDVATFTDDVLAKRIRDAEKILNNPGLSEARAQQIEDFLTGAEKERDSRAAKSRTVSHPDPAIDGQLVLATTADGRVIVANEGNKSGVSVVKDRLTTEPKPDRAPIKYAIPDEAMPELRKPGSGVSRERESLKLTVGERKQWIGENGRPKSGAPKDVLAKWRIESMESQISQARRQIKANEDAITDWRSRSYKSSEKTIEGRDEFGEYSGIRNVKDVNERRRSNVVKSAKSQIEDDLALVKDLENRIRGEENALRGMGITADKAQPQSESSDADFLKFLLGDQSGVSRERGAKTRADVENSPEFKKWFGDSKVVDDEGKPLVVYHGTGAAFDAFSKEKAGGVGFYFTRDAAAASNYAAQGDGSPNIRPVYLSITNPATSEAYSRADKRSRGGNPRAQIVEALKAEGFDGIIRKGEIIAFSPEQIKSATGNRGTFDPNDANITRQRGNQPPPMPDRVTARDLADNVRAEYRPAKNRPGTVYLNDWGLEALNAAHSIEFADASASGSDRITGGVNYKPERARILAEHIRDRAERPNFTPEGRKNLETMARQIELAADDGAVSIVPMVGQGMGKAKQTIRHEAFHAQQSTISPKIHELTTPRWLPAQKFGAKIGEELGRLGYEKHEHPAEAAAYVASGNWDAFGMSRDDARQFLTDYFDDVAYRHGKEAISKFRAIHPALQEVVEARRGTNEPRFGSPGLGRGIEQAVSRQRGGERPSGVAARSRGGVPGGDTGRVPRQSPTAGLRAITPESLRAQSGTETPQPRAAESPRRPGLAGITPESLRAEGGGGGGRASRAPREPVSGAPVGKDISGWDYIRSPLSNLNFKGTYERLAGDRGRDVSEIIRNAQVEIARKPDTERAALVSDLRKQLKPFKEEFRDNGQPGLANWLDEHVNALSDPDAAFKGLAGFLRGFHYNMKLRYNPKSAGLNWMQPLQTLWPHVTTREFAGLMKDARTPSVRRRVLEIAERESGGQVDEVSKKGRFEAVPKIIRNPFGVVSDTNRVMGHLAGEMFADRLGLVGDARARMAADWAKKIEYDNSRWDVPPLFRGKIAGVAGQFKPFTIKNIERLHADWKAAPIEELATNTWKGSGTLARRAKMIAGQVAIGGVRSIPGVKTIGGVLVLGALANAFNKAGLPPDEADKAAEMVYFGAPGLVEQDLSSSSMILDAPFGNTPAEQAVNFFGGPTGSLIVKAFQEGGAMYDAKSGPGSTAADKRKAAGIRLAKAVTPYSKTVEAAADLAQGNRPALKMERRQVPMTNLEIAGKLGMGTPLRQSKFYDEKDAFDWQKRAARKLRPVRP